MLMHQRLTAWHQAVIQIMAVCGRGSRPRRNACCALLDVGTPTTLSGPVMRVGQHPRNQVKLDLRNAFRPKAFFFVRDAPIERAPTWSRHAASRSETPVERRECARPVRNHAGSVANRTGRQRPEKAGKPKSKSREREVSRKTSRRCAPLGFPDRRPNPKVKTRVPALRTGPVLRPDGLVPTGLPAYAGNIRPSAGTRVS